MSVRIEQFVIQNIGGRTVIEGVLDPLCLKDIKIAKMDEMSGKGYQRGVKANKKLNEIAEYIRKTPWLLPAIQLGCRGEDYFISPDKKYIEVEDDVYDVEGQQRKAGANLVMMQAAMSADTERISAPQLKCTLIMGTTEQEELYSFINQTNATPVGSSHVVKLYSRSKPILDKLCRLNMDPEFALHNLVDWNDEKKKATLKTGIGFLKEICKLYRGWVKGGGATTKHGIMDYLEKVELTCTGDAVELSTRRFYGLANSLWHIAEIPQDERSDNPQTKQGFMASLATVFGDYAGSPAFWDGHTLSIHPAVKERLRLLNLKNRKVLRWSGSAGKGAEELRDHIVQHLRENAEVRALMRKRIAEDEEDCDQ